MKALRIHVAIGYVGIRAFFFFESIRVREDDARVQGNKERVLALMFDIVAFDHIPSTNMANRTPMG